ncbi:MAG: sulfatase [bacterium]|nr:sulfatase [bacterium]
MAFGLGTLTLLCIAGVMASPRPADTTHRDILLITVDTLRPDHMGLYGYARPTTPHLDEWFREGLVYERAYSAEANTPVSVTSFLSGQLPQEHGVRMFYQLLPDGVPLIPDLLPDAYQSAAFVSNTVLTDEAIGFASHFDHYDDFVGDREGIRNIYQRTAEDTTTAALKWLASKRDPNRPLFLWIHYVDPHGPYDPPPSWKRSFRHDTPIEIDLNRVLSYQRIEGVTDGLTYVDLYDEEIAYTDREVDRFLRGYGERRKIDDALVVFTADHGESMMEHLAWFKHGYHVWDEIVRVPLMLRGPGVRPGRSKALSSGIDVFGTILGFSGIDVSGRGHDLLKPDEIPPGREVYTEATWKKNQRRAAIVGAIKWVVILPIGGGQPKGGFWLDLEKDPHELKKRPWPTGITPAESLFALIRSDPDPGGLPDAYAKGRKLSAPKVAPGVNEEQMERLRALGYAE